MWGRKRVVKKVLVTQRGRDKVTDKGEGEVVVGRMKAGVQRKNRQATSKDSSKVNGFHLYYMDLAVSVMFPYTVFLFV